MVPACPQCSQALPPEKINTGQLERCIYCNTPVMAAVFPAIFKWIEPGKAAEHILVEGQSSCFYHEQKKAVAPCDNCGRFLCALCDVELNGRHICPGCLETARKKGSLAELEKSRTLYDGAALALAIVPLVIPLLWLFTIATAPTAIILAIMSWRKPGSLVARGRARAIIAIILALLEVTGWGFLIYAMYQGGVFNEMNSV
jgi:hypothetical protein